MDRTAILKKISFPVWTAEALAFLGLMVYIIQAAAFAYNTVSNLDEGAYLLKGYLFATGEYQPFDPGISTNKPPLAFLIPGYAQLLFGPGLRTGRYLAAFFGVLAVIGTWVAARRIGGKWLAAAAVWVLAASPMVIKFYSGSTQSTIACLLAWSLALSLGENRSFWELTFAGIFAGLMIFVRQNMIPVLPLLILYALWQHGRKAWGLVVFGSGTVLALMYAYWPDIFQLWTWFPIISSIKHSTPVVKEAAQQTAYTGGGEAVLWQPDIEIRSRILSFSQAIRYHFIPLAGAFTGAVHSIMVVLAQRIIPGGMALASGLILGFIFSSGALGLVYTGHLAELYGFPYVLTMTTGMVLIASPLALFLKEPKPLPVSAD